MKRWRPAVKQLERSNWATPSKNLFVLDDNPADSRYSRRLGLISLDRMEGRIIEIIK